MSTNTTTIRKFETGATRDTEQGKYDYEGFLSPLVLERFGEYMHKHRLQSDGTLRDSDNWQKGIPIPVYVKSLFRHFIATWKAHRQGKDFTAEQEENLCADLFNVAGMLHEVIKARESKPVTKEVLMSAPYALGKAPEQNSIKLPDGLQNDTRPADTHAREWSGTVEALYPLTSYEFPHLRFRETGKIRSVEVGEYFIAQWSDGNDKPQIVKHVNPKESYPHRKILEAIQVKPGHDSRPSPVVLYTDPTIFPGKAFIAVAHRQVELGDYYVYEDGSRIGKAMTWIPEMKRLILQPI